jgi:hypothetical protein
MCCGKKRRALAQGQLPASDSLATSHERTTASSLSEIELIYLRQSPIQLRGNVTGRVYQFSSQHSIQAVDRRDAAVFLRTPRLFRPTR